jgi:hypothetical protein
VTSPRTVTKGTLKASRVTVDTQHHHRIRHTIFTLLSNKYDKKGVSAFVLFYNARVQTTNHTTRKGEATQDKTRRGEARKQTRGHGPYDKACSIDKRVPKCCCCQEENLKIQKGVCALLGCSVLATHPRAAVSKTSKWRANHCDAIAIAICKRERSPTERRVLYNP